jgi:hypothetical protein
MKTTTTRGRHVLLAAAFALVPLGICPASDTSTSGSDSAAQTPAPAAAVSASTPAAVKLPYGVEDVLKLNKAQIGEDIILNYVQNSGTIYNLQPKDIVYLRDQGVSEKVIGEMLNQRKRVEMAAQNVPAVSLPVPMTPTSESEPSGGQAPAYTDAGYATAPLVPSSSSLYVIPSPTVSTAYYGSYYYPYYYGGYYGPSVVIGFAGHGYCGGHYYGHGHYYGGHGHGGWHGGHR